MALKDKMDFDTAKLLITEYKNSEIIEPKVAKVSEKGLIVVVNDTQIFIPISLSGISRGEDVNAYLDKNVKFKIT